MKRHIDSQRHSSLLPDGRGVGVGLFLSLFLALTSLTSCEIMEDEPIDAIWMELDRDSVVLMLGDTCRLNMRFLPDTVTTVTAYWELIDSTGVINVMQNGSVIATQVGEADVRVVAVNERLEDSCPSSRMRRCSSTR